MDGFASCVTRRWPGVEGCACDRCVSSPIWCIGNAILVVIMMSCRSKCVRGGDISFSNHQSVNQSPHEVTDRGLKTSGKFPAKCIRMEMAAMWTMPCSTHQMYILLLQCLYGYNTNLIRSIF